MKREIIHSDCLAALREMADASVDACVTDPPYELGFMGKRWDASGIAFSVDVWREVLRVLKPGAHLLAFGGTRTSHRMVCAIEDAGFEIRDSVAWLHGQGFPKSHNIGDGRGTALKPAHEPICVARKPLTGTVAANVAEWGTGALHIDACRVSYQGAADQASAKPQGRATAKSGALAGGTQNENERKDFEADNTKGRWPANVVLSHLDGCREVGTRETRNRLGGAGPIMGFGGGSGVRPDVTGHGTQTSAFMATETVPAWECESGCAVAELDAQAEGVARFFYCAKPSTREKSAGLQGRSTHPTVKSVALMSWLVRLVCPPGGLVLDPFAGSGSTGVACVREGFAFVGIEREAEYVEIARARIAHAETEPEKPRKRKAKAEEAEPPPAPPAPTDALQCDLFAEPEAAE